MNQTAKILPTRVLRLVSARPTASRFFHAVSLPDRASFTLRRLAVERAARHPAHDGRADHDLSHAV